MDNPDAQTNEEGGLIVDPVYDLIPEQPVNSVILKARVYRRLNDFPWRVRDRFGDILPGHNPIRGLEWIRLGFVFERARLRANNNDMLRFEHLTAEEMCFTVPETHMFSVTSFQDWVMNMFTDTKLILREGGIKVPSDQLLFALYRVKRVASEMGEKGRPWIGYLSEVLIEARFRYGYIEDWLVSVLNDPAYDELRSKTVVQLSSRWKAMVKEGTKLKVAGVMAPPRGLESDERGISHHHYQLFQILVTACPTFRVRVASGRYQRNSVDWLNCLRETPRFEALRQTNLPIRFRNLLNALVNGEW